MRFRKKPIVIEAVKYAGNGNVEPRGDVPSWMHNAFADGTLRSTNGNDPLVVRTLEGDMMVAIGDWIICGVKGEIYPCKPDIFSASYDPVEASDKIDLADAVREAIVASREYDPDFSTPEQIQMLRESFRESQLTVRRLTQQLTAANKRLAKAREKLKEIVVTEGYDAGVVLLSDDGPTHYDAELKCQVYDHAYFSPLGDALVELAALADGEG